MTRDEMIEALKPCPCGEIPSKLCIIQGATCKWAMVMGDCCNEWHIEFRTQYHSLDSAECMELATAAWNDATRSAPLAAPTEAEVEACAEVVYKALEIRPGDSSPWKDQDEYTQEVCRQEARACLTKFQALRGGR